MEKNKIVEFKVKCWDLYEDLIPQLKDLSVDFKDRVDAFQQFRVTVLDLLQQMGSKYDVDQAMVIYESGCYLFEGGDYDGAKGLLEEALPLLEELLQRDLSEMEEQKKSLKVVVGDIQRRLSAMAGDVEQTVNTEEWLKGTDEVLHHINFISVFDYNLDAGTFSSAYDYWNCCRWFKYWNQKVDFATADCLMKEKYEECFDADCLWGDSDYEYFEAEVVWQHFDLRFRNNYEYLELGLLYLEVVPNDEFYSAKIRKVLTALKPYEKKIASSEAYWSYQ